MVQAQQQQMTMLPGMPGFVPSMVGPGNPFHQMQLAMAGMKPEDALNAMHAFAAANRGVPPILPHMQPHVSLPSASTSASTPVNAPNATSSTDETRLTSSRSSRPRSRSPASVTNPPAMKRTKNEPHEDADGELEIDVQNDDGVSVGGSAPHTNGTSQTGRLSRPPKDGRDSAHSISSRDSATPKSVISKPVTCFPLEILNDHFSQQRQLQ